MSALNLSFQVGDFFQFLNDRLLLPLVELLHFDRAGSYLENLLWLALALWILGVGGRLLWGKDSGFSRIVLACLSIQFTYLLAIGLYALIPALRFELQALPFVSISRHQFQLMELDQISADALSGGIIRLALLSGLVILVEDRMPKGKKLLSWLALRAVNGMLSIGIYSFLTLLLGSCCPGFFGTPALAVVLAVAGSVILLGIIRCLLNIAMNAVPKLIDKLYSFFYSREKGLGKGITRTVYSALGFLLVVLLLNREGIGCFPFEALSVLPLLGAGGILLLTTRLFERFF